jgi:hypothetical protein
MIKAAGRMGWRPDDFWFSTPSFFFAALAGHMEQERDRTHAGLNQARLIAYYAIAPHLEKGKRLSFSDIVRLPGDDEAEAARFDEVTQEELDKFNAAADRGYEQHNGVKWQPQHN